MQLARTLATCPPACGLAYGVNTTFDAASGAGDAFPGDGFCETAPGNNVCTLRAAIEEANAYSQTHGGASNGIGFNLSTADPGFNGIFWTINLASVLPDLITNVNIGGPGPDKLTVKRNTAALHRIFSVTTAVTVTIAGITITNGNVGAGGVGGDLSNSSGTVSLTNCVLSGGVSKNGGCVFNNTGTVSFTDCTLSGNAAGNIGGGIQNFGTANFTNCTLSGNSSNGNFGGGIYNAGIVNVTNCTLSGNFTMAVSTSGGGIYNSGTANVTNSTISGNTAANAGGGIFSVGSATNIKSSIIALNTSGNTGPDLSGSFTPQGFNLIGKNDGAAASFPPGNPNGNNDIVGTSVAPINPNLDPGGLQNNGGKTKTIALLPDSLAIDKGTSIGSTGTLTTDQRGPGYARTVDGLTIANAAGGDGTDVGAFEFGVTLRLLSVARSGNDIVITVQAAQGATYRLERKLNLADAQWQIIPGVNDSTANSTGPIPLTDLGGAASGKAFYRVRLL